MAQITATWVAGTAGSWTTAADWSDGIVPGQGTNTDTAVVFAGGNASYAVALLAGKTVDVGGGAAGTTTGVALQVDDAYVTLDIAGDLTAGSPGGAITEVNAGTINVQAGGTLAIASTDTQTGGVLNVRTAGSVIIAANSGVSIALTGGTIGIQGGVLDTAGNLNQSGGVIDLNGGVLSVATAASLNLTGGSILIGGGTLDAGTLTQAGGIIRFDASGGLLQFGIGTTAVKVAMGATGVTDTVDITSNIHLGRLTLANFFQGDVLAINTTGALTNGMVAYTGTDGTGTLTIRGTISGNAFKDTVHITTPGAAVPTNADFILSSGANFFAITSEAICYLRGTRVLTPTGQVCVEDLEIGDLLVTRFNGIQPIKWIGRQNYDSRFLKGDRNRTPVSIRAGALGERVPARDLSISPGHSMLLDGQLVLGRLLVNGVSVTQEPAPGDIHYFQIELDRHDCIVAEGAWSETFADGPGLREQFHNAADFAALYPDHAPPGEVNLCAPRPERGAKLAAVLQTVVARLDGRLKPGPLRGAIDRVAAPWTIEGWANDADHPELPVLLELLVEDEVVGRALACDYRQDLETAGYGTGRCAFFLTSPVRLQAGPIRTLRMRRACDHAEIRMTEACTEMIDASQEASTAIGLRLAS